MSHVILGTIATVGLTYQAKFQRRHTAIAGHLFISGLGILREFGQGQAFEAAQSAMEVRGIDHLGCALFDHLRHGPRVVAWQRSALERRQQEEEVQRAVDHEGKLPLTERFPEFKQTRLLFSSGIILLEAPFILSAHVGNTIFNPSVEIHIVLCVELQSRGLAEEALVPANQVIPSVGEGKEVVADEVQNLLAACSFLTHQSQAKLNE
mmetsp:Transcript_58765/g.128670  ORF Transcript_58765/g.128670 Transcript_58765/m.128670 type:complete len:208 (+) Transcript_58765:684-1307(+)